MKVLVTGVKGQLGFDVVSELKRRNIDCVGADIEDFDITDAKSTEKFILSNSPDAVVHCAAYTNVNKAQEDEELCRKINVEGTANIAAVCESIGAKLIYISTDYVFGGEGDLPQETDEPKAPLNVYGKTKLEGENEALRLCSRLFIVRTSWVFGKNGGNFVKTMLSLSDTKDSLNVVCDQIGSPTYTKDLAVLLCDMVKTEKYGVYHATNENFCSWAEFARKIMEYGNKKTVINDVKTQDYPSAAVRPLNSRLSKKSLDNAGFCRLPAWEDALERYLSEILSAVK